RQAAAAGGDYNVALIDLEDGVRLMSRVVGTANDDIRIGLKGACRKAGDRTR
ncbi:MAG: OB-fold domain-containing protein, partial [Afipia sp.]